jgi:hypothetical protein
MGWELSREGHVVKAGDILRKAARYFAGETRW